MADTSTEMSSSQTRTEIVVYSGCYDIFNEEEEFFENNTDKGQFMIVDSGCPRGLMGWKEFDRLKQKYEYEIIKLKKNENFRFGPSKSYSSDSKIRIPMMIGDSEFYMDFFAVDANIPILVGNDFLKPMGGNIKIGKKQLEIDKIGETLEMIETPGGHFVVPLKHITAPKHILDK